MGLLFFDRIYRIYKIRRPGTPGTGDEQDNRQLYTIRSILKIRFILYDSLILSRRMRAAPLCEVRPLSNQLYFTRTTRRYISTALICWYSGIIFSAAAIQAGSS